MHHQIFWQSLDEENCLIVLDVKCVEISPERLLLETVGYTLMNVEVPSVTVLY